MSERFKLQHINDLTDQEYMRLKKITDNGELITLGEVVDLLNEQQATIEQLRTELAICQQSKNDDSRFQVWEVPPIPKGTRITFSTTTERSDKNE